MLSELGWGGKMVGWESRPTCKVENWRDVNPALLGIVKNFTFDKFIYIMGLLFTVCELF